MPDDALAVWSVPMRTRFRGITVREGVLLRGLGRRAGASGARSSSTTPRWPSPGCAAPRRPRPVTGPLRCAPRCRSTSRCRPSAPSRRTGSCSTAAAAPPRSRSPSRGRPWPTTRPGSRRCATRSDPTAPSASTPTVGGRSTRPSPPWPCSTAPPAASSTSSSPAPPSRTSPPYAAGWRCRSLPTSRSAAPPTPTGCATSRPRTWRCSRCSRSAGCGPACGSPRTSGCPWWSPRRSRRRSASPRGSRWPPRCRSCRTRAGSRPFNCWPTTWLQPPLLPVDGALPVRRPDVDPAALARVAADPERAAHWAARLAEVRAWRAARQDGRS